MQKTSDHCEWTAKVQPLDDSCFLFSFLVYLQTAHLIFKVSSRHRLPSSSLLKDMRCHYPIGSLHTFIAEQAGPVMSMRLRLCYFWQGSNGARQVCHAATWGFASLHRCCFSPLAPLFLTDGKQAWGTVHAFEAAVEARSGSEGNWGRLNPSALLLSSSRPRADVARLWPQNDGNKQDTNFT